MCVSCVCNTEVMKTSAISRMINPHVSTPYEDLNAFRLVILSDRIVAPTTIVLRNVPIAEAQGYEIVEMCVDWNAEAQEYVTTGLAVQGGTGAPVNGVLLRKIPVDKYKHLAVSKFLLLKTGDDEYRPFDVSSFGALNTAAKDGPTDANLKYVARIYRVSKHISDSPRKAVADAFGFTDRTASYWINHARERGYMRDDE